MHVVLNRATHHIFDAWQGPECASGNQVIMIFFLLNSLTTKTDVTDVNTAHA